ncbi:MAG: hypothetical protein MUF24_09785 [Chitinophagaceae bacterium]|nr:hypothetical protein [Chitinophagaceae bacterium]
MAWNKYYIIIKSPKFKDTEEILTKLNLGQYKPTKEVPLNYSNKPETLFTGFFNDSFIVVHSDLAFHFFGDTQSDTEKLFIDTFPDSEIAVLVENSTVGLYSYAIIDKGQKIRMKNGCDGEVYIDKGDLLPEEKEISSQKIFEDEEIKEMKEGGMTDEEITAMINHEASWRVPNLLTKRYFGETVGSIDTNKIILTEYSFHSLPPDRRAKRQAEIDRLIKYFQKLSNKE